MLGQRASALVRTKSLSALNIRLLFVHLFHLYFHLSLYYSSSLRSSLSYLLPSPPVLFHFLLTLWSPLRYEPCTMVSKRLYFMSRILLKANRSVNVPPNSQTPLSQLLPGFSNIQMMHAALLHRLNDPILAARTTVSLVTQALEQPIIVCTLSPLLVRLSFPASFLFCYKNISL